MTTTDDVTTEHTLSIMERILARLPQREPQPDTAPCTETEPGEFCTGEAHYNGDPVAHNYLPVGCKVPRPALLRECPRQLRARTATRIAAEQERLCALCQRCAGGFDSYDPQRQPEVALLPSGRPRLQQDGEPINPRELAGEALALVRAFAAQRPPKWGVILTGSLGLGKTHLLLAAHFQLLEHGIRSHFVSTTDLRDLFRRLGARDPAEKEEAEGWHRALLQAQVIIWDDIGDVDGDQRWRGAFAEGVKHLLDRSKAVWAISTNLDYKAACKHPDVGAKLISRLVDGGARVVRMEGRDQRLSRTER